MKIIKHLLLKSENDVHGKPFLDGIAQIRNTPRADGVSPCQVVFGRSVRTLLPTLSEALGSNEFVEKARSKKKIIDAKQKVVYDQHSKDLKTLDPNTAVWV